MNITINHTSTNFSTNWTTKKYIVWHDTGVRGQSDEQNAAYFKTVYREASAHYFIDEDSITEVVSPNYVAWHCGDGNGLYGITNQNSIGIELCVEANGLFKPETIANAVWLGKKLMKDFGIPLANNVRHYDASRKNCPQFLNTDGKWTKWYEFKAQLGGSTPIVDTTPVIVRKPVNYNATVVSGGYSIDSKPWGEKGVENWGNTSDHIGKVFYFYEENETNEYANAVGVGWIDKRAIEKEKVVVASILHLPNGQNWTIYPPEGGYTEGDIISLEGSSGETTYTILGERNNGKILIVEMERFGTVGIYFDPDKGAKITKVLG